VTSSKSNLDWDDALLWFPDSMAFGGQQFYPLPMWVPLAIVIRLRGASPCVVKVDGFPVGGVGYFPF
jgi:hypothetical protein